LIGIQQVEVQGPDGKSAIDKVETSESATTTAGVRVAIDPETGTRVPAPAMCPEVSSKLHDALSQSAEGLTIVHRPDGSKHVNLEGRFSSGIWASVTPNGVQHSCVTSVPSKSHQHGQPQQTRMEVK
jgi:hypothetical protein